MLQTMTKPEMTTTSMWITPDIAAEFLRGNTDNRRIRPVYVRQLADIIRRGEWMHTHQGIAFAADGHLLDGQHRLSAIVASGIAVRMTVSRNCDPATFIVLDAGLKRQMTDHLGLRTVTVATLRAFAQLAGGMASGTQITTMQVRDAAVWAKPYIDQLLAEASESRKVMTSSAVLCGAAIRLATAPDPYAVLAAWSALAKQDYAAMPPSIQAFERRISRGMTARADWKKLLILSFKAFDLSRNVGNGKMLVINEDARFEEISTVVIAIRDRELARHA